MQNFGLHCVILIVWLLNPWLGFLASLITLIYSKQTKSLFFFTAVLIGITTILYQLSLPLPTDLVTTKAIYTQINANPIFWKFFISRDPLSFGVLSLLSYVFPGHIISFYIFSVLLNFGALWIIFKKESQNLKREYQVALLFAFFLTAIDYNDSHHYLRQTTAILIFITSSYFYGIKKVGIILASILWHGSIVLFLPILFFLNFVKSPQKRIIGFCAILVLCFLLSQINIYGLLQNAVVKEHVDFTFFDRFLMYFQNPQYKSYFDISYEQGNSKLYFYLLISLTSIVYGLTRKLNSSFLLLLMALTPSAIFFQHHVLIFDRVAYMLDLTLWCFWIVQIKSIPEGRMKESQYLVFILCLMKIVLFVWPLNFHLRNEPLILYSPITLIKNCTSWPINN